ncbi:hsftype dnabinding protein [Phytophthora cinnamomi]|uniref:hsftype dnabinding protein n=1 Tax=Phytophthora cinnamomi TaxID=4785 RepID=UPI00355A7404|nr:hsftype dnabinding protein [Phytophthora cinnamomi]
MLGERDRAAFPAPAAEALVPPSSSSVALFGASLEAAAYPLFGAKEEPSDTRRASLVAAQEEPEQEQELNDNKDLKMATSAVNVEHKKAPEVVHVIKRRNVGVPKFLRFLFQILEAEDPDIITWSHEGTAFQIIQPDELASQILPRYFKHNKVSSFQRQLNYFGFKKWTKTQTNICTFSHPFFLRADKDRMKLIKRKERANPAVMSAAMAATIKSNPIDLMNQMHAQDQARAHAEAQQFEAHDLAEARSQLPTQQALKRQKSNTLSGATVTFLNSAAAGRRHSTGMLPGSEAYGLAAAAAAAHAAAQAASAASLPGRKRAGTPGEQEFELEMEARNDAVANASSAQQQMLYMRKVAEAKELSQRYPYQPVGGKRQSLPHVLPPGFGDTMGMGMNLNGSAMGGSAGFGPPRGGINLGRRRSDQLLTNYNPGVTGGKPLSISQIEEFMSSSATSSSQHTIFASAVKADASIVLPISSNSVSQDIYPLQQRQGPQPQQLRQQMNRQPNIYGGGSGAGSARLLEDQQYERNIAPNSEISTNTNCTWPTELT